MKLHPFDLCSLSASGEMPSSTDGVCSSSSSVNNHGDSHSFVVVVVVVVVDVVDIDVDVEASPMLSPRVGGGVGSWNFPCRYFDVVLAGGNRGELVAGIHAL